VTSDIEVTGAPVHRVHGRYLLVPVHFDRPNAFGAVSAVLHRRRRLPVGTPQSRQEVRSAARDAESLFRRSQQDAAAAAAAAAGLDVGLHGDGAEVVEVLDSRTRQSLRVGDVLLAIDTVPVRVASDADRLLAPHGPEARVRVTVERAGRRIEVPVTTPRLGGLGSPGLPVVLVTRNPDYKLPFQVRFRHRSIGGPSGGLVYALALTDLLGASDLAGGRAVAATGTIDPAGEVGPVGYLDAKLQAASRAHVTVLLVPMGQLGGARKPGLPVRGVLTLREALEYLTGRS
jgi:PDZ domain-containing protein